MNTLVQLAGPPVARDPRLRPELLAPAGDLECVRAAIENGADAVYFGLDTGFNARARATNFSPESLGEVMTLLHRRGVKGYVALNVLAFSSELAEVERLARLAAAAGVDAVLVQDLGVARLIRTAAPGLSIHASTQMTLTSAEGVEFARRLGVDRVVLARELSIREIGKIHGATDLPLEAFVHGALCVAYSGQCLTSESFGGRSANRGQCAQACRLPYDLICDGRDVPTEQVKYLLSPQDLAGFELIPRMIDAGVVSLKIEGRLKTPEYVANITRHYREAIDTAMAGRPVTFTPRQIEEMELSFSRGFSPGWLEGCDHKRLVPGTSSAKRGVLLGTVRSVQRGRVRVQLVGSVKRGDGVVFDCQRATDDEQGGRVYEVFRGGKSLDGAVTGGEVELTFAQGAIDFRGVWSGQALWKNDDPELTSRLRKTFASDVPRRRQPLAVQVHAAVGKPLVIVAQAASGARCELASDEPLQAATRHALTADVLREQLGRLGGTPYELTTLEATIDGAPMCPFSVLGKLRHQLVEQLDASAAALHRLTLDSEPALPRLRAAVLAARETAVANANSTAPAELRVLCRNLAQLRAMLEVRPRGVYVDFQDIREYREAVSLAREAKVELFLATPRIQKPDEAGLFVAMAKHQPDGILVRNLGGLVFCRTKQIPWVADFSLNTANELTAELLRGEGALAIAPSYDLNRDQLLDLVDAVPPEWLEPVIHQHMPMFHMEHCVFCAMLSPGTNKTNCGRPCDEHRVELRDRLGMQHPLKADVGCRNTLFNAVPQSAAEVVPQLLARGVKRFRVELLDDAPDDARRTLALYGELLAGTVTGREVWSRLRAMNRVGVTRGTLEERRNPLAIL